MRDDLSQGQSKNSKCQKDPSSSEEHDKRIAAESEEEDMFGTMLSDSLLNQALDCPGIRSRSSSSLVTTSVSEQTSSVTSATTTALWSASATTTSPGGSNSCLSSSLLLGLQTMSSSQFGGDGSARATVPNFTRERASARLRDRGRRADTKKKVDIATRRKGINFRFVLLIIPIQSYKL